MLGRKIARMKAHLQMFPVKKERKCSIYQIEDNN
jgi:hypothetical protein